MKPSIKKLRTCVYSKPVAPGGIFAEESHQTNKLVCDHPEMKINWTVEVCEGCKVYINRNKSSEPERKPKPRKPRTPRK